MKIDIEDILKRCKAKEEKAFEQLYKQYYRVLFGIALRYSKAKEEAEDVLQESFIKLFNSIDTYSGKGSFEGWMKRIVQNTAINNYRSRTKFDLHIDITNMEHELSDDNFTTVFDAFDVKELVVLLNQLPDGYRMVINLYYIDEYTHKEIALLLKISEGTSKSQLFKAKAYLKQLIELQQKQQAV